jgi:MFS family permease
MLPPTEMRGEMPMDEESNAAEIGVGASGENRDILSDNAAASTSGDQHAKQTVRALFAILCYQGYAFSILGLAAPFIGKTFGLDQSGIARMYAWISINALGALILSRMADQIGRRRILMLGLIVTPLGSLAAALATKAAWFIACEVIVYSAIGATFASAIVMMAEALPVEKRAEGQGWANFAIACGGGGPVILAPTLAHFGLSWRWMPGIAAAGILIAPAMIRRLPESLRWERVAAEGASSGGHFYDVFGARYRRRTIPLIVATLMGEAAAAAVSTWTYYHAVSVVGLTPAQGSLILLAGGTVSTAGLVIGARMAEMIGRVRSIFTLILMGAAGHLAFYWGPPRHFGWPATWLLLALIWFSTTGRGALVAGNSAVTELFPTALRGTIMGWLTLTIAFSAIGGQATIAILAKPLGGLSNVVGWISLLGIPCALIWWIFIDETRGLSLEVASGEAPTENPAAPAAAS